MTAGTFGAMSVVGLLLKGPFGIWPPFNHGSVWPYYSHCGQYVCGQQHVRLGFDIHWRVLVCGLTAYDTQKMKEILRQSEGAGDTNMLKIALLCSLSLYLDFINLFLYLLRILATDAADY